LDLPPLCSGTNRIIKLDEPLRVIVLSNNNNSYTCGNNGHNNSSAITSILVANHAVVLSTGSSAVIPSQIQASLDVRKGAANHFSNSADKR